MSHPRWLLIHNKNYNYKEEEQEEDKGKKCKPAKPNLQKYC